MRRSRPDNPRDVRGWYSTMQASRAASKRRTGTVVPHDSHTSVTASSSTSIWSGSKTTGAQHSRHATWVTWPDPRWRLSMMAKRRPRAERYTSSRSPVGGHTPQGPRRPRQPSSSHRPHVSVMTRSPTTASFLAMGGRGVRQGPCKPPGPPPVHRRQRRTTGYVSCGCPTDRRLFDDAAGGSWQGAHCPERTRQPHRPRLRRPSVKGNRGRASRRYGGNDSLR